MFLNRFPDYNLYTIEREVFSFDRYSTSKSFENICAEVTIDIFNKYENIYLLWSGGIDSTVVLLSFLKYSKKFFIVTTEFTEIEYYDLYNILKKDENINLITISNKDFNKYIYNLNNGIIITGDLGDQLFLSPLIFGNEDIKNLPYRMFIPDDIIEKNKNKIDLILNNTINANVANYLWGLDFIYKWNIVVNRLPKFFNKNNFLSFFNNIEFEKFAVSNQVKNSKWEGILYKKDMRDFIYKETNDYEYSYTKEKIGSQKVFLKKDFKNDYYL